MPDKHHEPTVEDMELAARAREGDMAAFETLVRRYRNDVYALCYYFTRNREDAWDLSQEVFIKAHRALPGFRGDAGFKTWVLRIAANQSKDHLKKRRLQTTPFEDTWESAATEAGQTPAETMEAKEIGAAIDAAVSRLPLKHRTAFMLREYEGLSYQEMAEVMHCSVGTVMSRLFHARKRLQQMLGPQGFMEDNNDV
ncbi:MAG: ECF RNA polymerase sigma-E factor [Candidatus Hydrogenedentes bacterium ADurb.Bin101]|nr:sigma-70 family RNA polymerase sigma factor [Candidatus Hydrogenedentota bacterium]OQC02614.1 MAG: ECF RNA polymerase sigma-E factor [Candidatus Hydrogenedentes bacterium ADurb.Bin101]HOC70733.1 sigma-70 family RNA polymerase sigma factor [Candidatus Hydrogenedentota bacterium]